MREGRPAGTAAWAAAAVSIGFNVAGVVLIYLTRDAPVARIYGLRGAATIIAVPFTLTGALLTARRPRNPIGWCFLAVGVTSGFSLFLEGYASYSFDRHARSLPLTDVLAWFQSWSWAAMVPLTLTYPMLLFPTGRLPSRGWRWVGWAAVPTAVGMSFAVASEPGQLQSLPDGFVNPYALSAQTSETIFSVAGGPYMAVIVASVAAMWRRFRRSTGDEHQQMKWLLFASAVTTACLLANLIGVSLGVAEDAALWRGLAIVTQLSVGGIAVAAGVGVLRYRLYDIDVVINRAFTFAMLGIAITALYVGVVAATGAALGTRGEQNAAVSIVGTAIVAAAFHPLRQRLHRLANKLVYGRRATPEDILSELGSSVAAASTIEEALPKVGRLVVEATAAEHATIWLVVGSELRAAASWPEQRVPTARIALDSGDDLPQLPDADHVYPVRHNEDLLGAMAVRVRRGETLPSADHRLLDNIAAHAGLILRNARLIAELRASRQRLVAAQDLERRRIERDLHDGAQQQLVSVSVKATLAKALVNADPPKAEEILDELRAETKDALENLRALARGIYPPLLAEGGLTVALPAQASRAAVRVHVTCHGIGRYAQELEATVYFCVLEALQNAAKYAQATQVVVEIAERDGALTFSVSDDGHGFDPRTAARGAGLTNMTDRLDAIGGSLRIRSSAGSGTTITGAIPVSVGADRAVAGGTAVAAAPRT